MSRYPPPPRLDVPRPRQRYEEYDRSHPSLPAPSDHPSVYPPDQRGSPSVQQGLYPPPDDDPYYSHSQSPLPPRHPDPLHYPPDPYSMNPSPDQYTPTTEAYHQPHYFDQNQTYPPHGHHTDDAYYPEYDQPHGPHYDYDEKHQFSNSQYPPSLNHTPLPTSFHSDLKPPSFSSQKGLETPSRGSVAAQMAAEGAIPEKAGLRMWRSDEHSGAFTRGGRGKCCGRCCGCTVIVVVVIIVGFIAGFLLWVRPPNATFNGIAPPTAGNQVDLQPSGFLLNFDLNIGVTNPNFFGASFSRISAKAYYPLNKAAPLGGGELENVEIKSHSNTTIAFPFQINYTSSLDPNRAILADIASKCGFLGATKSPVKISFDVTLSLKVIAITISPTFSSSASFACPLKQSDFTTVLGGNQNLDALSSMLTGSSAPASSKTGGGGGRARSARDATKVKKRSSDEY